MSQKHSLKIFLPKKLTAAGGTSTFARNFKQGMELRGHSVFFDWQPDYDVLLASPTAPLAYLIHAKINNRLIVHRLDGVYYPGSSAGWLWRILNIQLSIIRTIFADALIYQSEYSEKACDYRLAPMLREKPKKTIYNGVDTTVFSPDRKMISLRENPAQQVFISASRFRTEDQIIPLLKIFAYYRKHHQQNSKLILIGPFQERVSDIPSLHKNQPGVSFLGTIPHDQLAPHLRAADVFVLTHKTPPCPNNVLEAMACGLPVCGVADGAMPELIATGTEGELVPEPKKNEPFPIETVADRLAIIMKHQADYANRSRERALREFNLDDMLNKYDLLLRNSIQAQ